MASPLGWFWKLLSHGEAPVVDPDAVVEAALLNLVEGTMVVSRLQSEGFVVSLAESRNVPWVTRPMARVFCRAGDLDAVRRAIDEPPDDPGPQGP